MKTRPLLLSLSALALIASAPLRADDCRAEARFRSMDKEAKPSSPGKKVLSVAASVYDVNFDVNVSGCPDDAARPAHFAKPAYGTITYKIKKRYGKAAEETEEQRSENWNKDLRELSLTDKVEGHDAKGLFELTGVEVVRTVCGCR